MNGLVILTASVLVAAALAAIGAIGTTVLSPRLVNATSTQDSYQPPDKVEINRNVDANHDGFVRLVGS